MKLFPFVCCLSLLSVIAGCNDSSTASGDPADKQTPAAESSEKGTATAKEKGEETDPEAATMGQEIELTPANTSIEFVGLHTDKDNPAPRHGSFQQFSGTAMVDQTLMSVQVDIETASITTTEDGLTTHLKKPDFFDVNQYPQARFESTKILDKEDGTVEITGNLTMLDQTHSITFPAKVNAEGDFTLEAEFEIDRTQWGMNYGVDKVEKIVAMTIKIGKK